MSVVGLGMESQPGPDTAVLKQLAALGERLRDFDQGGTLPSEPYVAPAYRGVILEQQGIEGVQVRDWPWVDIQPSDFTFPADPNALRMGTRTLTPEEAAAVGVQGFENGIMSGVYLRARRREGLLAGHPAAAARRDGVGASDRRGRQLTSANRSPA